LPSLGVQPANLCLERVQARREFAEPLRVLLNLGDEGASLGVQGVRLLAERVGACADRLGKRTQASVIVRQPLAP
jgi:hypothetical protein